MDALHGFEKVSFTPGFRLSTESSASLNLLLIPSSVFFLSVTVFIYGWFFFVSRPFLCLLSLVEVLIEFIYSTPKSLEQP